MRPDEVHNEHGQPPNLQLPDGKAFRMVYEQYFRQLCYYVEELTGNGPVAEDIATESFIKLLEKRYSFDNLAKLKSFLFTVAHNAALDYLKSEKRHRSAHDAILKTSLPEEQTIEAALIRSEVLKTIYGKIEELPAQCREVIRLSFVEGKSVTEIAAIMDLAYKTVQNQKARGLQLLRISVLKSGLDTILVLHCLQLLRLHS